MSIKLDLTLDEVNGVLISLGKLPFEQVEPLISKIRGQAVPQAEALAQAEAAEAEPEAPAE